MMDFPLPAVIRHTADQCPSPRRGPAICASPGRPPMPITDVQADDRAGTIEVNPVNLLPNWGIPFQRLGGCPESIGAQTANATPLSAQAWDGWRGRLTICRWWLCAMIASWTITHFTRIMARPNMQHCQIGDSVPDGTGR